jgi:hypothetical protein
MSDFRIESPEERHARYVRLARAATEAAARSSLPVAKAMYVKLAQAWVVLADENDENTDVGSGETPAKTRDSARSDAA